MTATQIPSYPKVWAVGSPAVATIFSHGDEIVVQEKVDGSQISFGKIDGELVMRSKGQPLYAADPDGMFKLGIESILERADAIPDNIIIRGEYLNRPRHNTLAYNRVPRGHIVIFDVQYLDGATLEWAYIMAEKLESWAELLGLEAVPELARGVIEKPTDLTDLLERESFLGGPKIEGFVVKNYHQLTRFGDQMLAKYVSPAFKEKHTKDWKNRNPTGKDFIGLLSDEFATPARFAKGVQHLRERGQITGEARDIGPLMKELAEDLVAEHKDYILERLWSQFGKDIVRGAGRGAPEWYKAQLLDDAFDDVKPPAVNCWANGEDAETKPFIAEIIGEGPEAFEQRWWCVMPPLNVTYQIVRDAWHSDGKVRNIYEIKIVGAA